MRTRFIIFIAIVQSILFAAHAFLYFTWTAFHESQDPSGVTALQLVVALLSISFVAASLLSFRYSHLLVRVFYITAATWLGMLSFGFFASLLCWIVYAGFRLSGVLVERRIIADVLFAGALLISVYGVLNAAWIRPKRITVRLPNLPPEWRGRMAALVSDLHLGDVRGYGFARRLVAKLNALQPEVVFITGDLYDGSKVDAERLARPWSQLSLPLGAYFVTGNHEEFSDPAKFLEPLQRAGIRVLKSEKVVVDGLQVVGVYYHDSVNPNRFRAILQQAGISRDRASILLTHSPNGFQIAAEEGISLQLSGHTHGGQFIPYTWIASRIYRQYAYGLRRFADMLVYTSCGVGTWGPPMRVRTRPEIVLLSFE